MTRITALETNYKPVVKLADERYRISFDKVIVEDGIAQWTLVDYVHTPATEEMQEDVRNYTIQRYINEGLEPPKREEIDVSDYIITQ